MHIRDAQKESHRIAREHGWWDSTRNFGELCMLIVSEVSELFEAYRHNMLHTPTDKKTEPQITFLEEELADVCIRCLDLAEREGIDLETAIEAKMAYNETRPYKHGGKLA